MKRWTKNLLLVLMFLILGCLLSHFLINDTDVLIIDNEFLTTFVGVVLGISSTIVTFIFSSTDKIWGVISNTFQDEGAVEIARKKFKAGYAELIEDSSFIFVIFILIVICVISSAIDIPNISFPHYMPKEHVINAIKTGLFINCLVAICDLFFSLSNILKLVLYETKKNSTRSK